MRPHLAWAKRLAGAPLALQPWTLPLDPPADPLELARALAGAAVLAPSQWNTQPWRLELNGSSARLLTDASRAMPVNDPERRGMMMSLGAALENLLVALRSYGFRPSVTYFPSGETTSVVASVTWSRAESRRDRELFAAITERRTNRENYDGRGLFMQNRAALTALVPDDLRLYWLDDRDGLRATADLAHDAIHEAVMDHRAQAECYGWMRGGDDEARTHGDGVTLDELSLSGPARWMAGHYFNPKSRMLGLGAGSAAKQGREQIRSAGAVALFTAPRGGEPSWLAAGQAYERFVLRATGLGIAHQPIQAPILRSPYRTDLVRQFGAVGEEPLLLVRLGHARRPKPSVRRNVSVVATFRAT
jgi:nitroreductase